MVLRSPKYYRVISNPFIDRHAHVILNFEEVTICFLLSSNPLCNYVLIKFHYLIH